MVLMCLVAGKEWRCRCREWTCGHSAGRKGWDEMRSSLDIYTPSCVKQLARGKLLYNTGSLVWCSVMP